MPEEGRSCGCNNSGLFNGMFGCCGENSEILFDAIFGNQSSDSDEDKAVD
mgnify:CR=1 FL=1